MNVTVVPGSLSADAALPEDRQGALGAAHQLLEELQDRPGDPALLRLLERWSRTAADLAWGEVHVLLLFDAVVHADLLGEDQDRLRVLADELLAAATSYGDERLVALAVAARPAHLTDSGHAEPFGDDLAGCLAHVVSVLEDLAAEEGGAAAMLTPAAYVDCAQGYRRQDLWELELEMYDLADASLMALFASADGLAADPALRPVLELNLRVLRFNRLESTVSLVCALLEVGHREAARQAALARRRFTAQEWADLPDSWRGEARAMDHLLAVVAGETDDLGDPRVVPARLYDEVAGSAWGGYAASLLLATALANQEAGDLVAAADFGSRAAALLNDFRPSLRTWAMGLGSLGSATDDPARRYADHLARVRWDSRSQVLNAARSRLAAARTLRQVELLRRRAYVDELTGLANRHAYVRHLEALRQSDADDRISVAIIDLDHFKAINDTFGHAVGDAVLRVIGRLLSEAVRSSDLAVRLGGDEFVLLVGFGADADIAGRVGRVVERVRDQQWGDLAPGLAVTISAGVAIGAATDVEQLVEEADQRLYRAKSAGRDRSEH